MKGVSTGWESVDNHYRVVPGELTVITGVPNAAKSEWVDALMCNRAVQHEADLRAVFDGEQSARAPRRRASW